VTKNQPLQIRVSTEEKEQIRAAAGKAGLKMSEYVRRQALRADAEPEPQFLQLTRTPGSLPAPMKSGGNNVQPDFKK
jgi:hypothetical protein